MIVVYDSMTGLGKKFAEALGYPTQPINVTINEPCILVTRNDGLGKIPETTYLFLEQYKKFVIGVVVNGNKRFGPFYCKAADKISKIFNIPVIRKISGSGNKEDIDYVRHYLNNISNTQFLD